jgi:hypothetical protein
MFSGLIGAMAVAAPSFAALPARADGSTIDELATRVLMGGNPDWKLCPREFIE